LSGLVCEKGVNERHTNGSFWPNRCSGI
jgi:hypothetical protein